MTLTIQFILFSGCILAGNNGNQGYNPEAVCTLGCSGENKMVELS